MKLFTTKEKKVHTKDCGWVRITTYYLLGIPYFNVPEVMHEARQEQEEPLSRRNLDEANDYLKWREKLNLGSIDDDTFIQIINTRF